MSDVERPSENGGAGASGGVPQKLPARNMADIARLFLDGARPNTPPRRTPPKGVPAAKPAQARGTMKDEATPSADGQPVTAVLGLAAAADAGAHWKALIQAA